MKKVKYFKMIMTAKSEKQKDSLRSLLTVKFCLKSPDFEEKTNFLFHDNL